MKNFSNKNECLENLIFIDENAEVSDDVIIKPNVQILGKCKIKSGVIIHSNSVVENSEIGKGCEIRASHIENSVLKTNVKIGPFAHIRPNSVVEDDCKIGNFVEIKASKIGKGTKVSHLAYVGDAEIGENCNIGCGAIFVNYNGTKKQKILVGKNCFIGSNCNIIAPVIVENNSYICAGTTLTKNTNNGDFVIGRCRECVKPNRAKNYLKELV